MPLKSYKPTSPGRRGMTVLGREEITAERPCRALVRGKKRISARNNEGHMTVRRRGGGNRRRYRIVDFRRDKDGVPATVASIEYDPNRSANIALLNYADGEKRYILAPEGLQVGQRVESGPKAEIAPGNTLPILSIPLGTMVHNVELKPGKGGQLVRAAGTAAQLLAKEGEYAQLRLPSGEVRMVLARCRATIGQVGNLDHVNVTIGKAGRTRWLGRRPKVRGVAMNPVDHPLGGGEGKSSGGRHPCSPWGWPTKGYKTRRNKRTKRFIVRDRRFGR